MRKKNSTTANAIVKYVDNYFEINKTTPSLREIETGLKISRQTVHRYLKEMNDQGLLFYEGGRIVTKYIEQLSERAVRNLPVFGFVSCGNPSLEFQQTGDYLDIPESFLDNCDYYILVASGDSMKNVGIDDGDSVLIKVQTIANIGDIVVAIDDSGQTTLKRLMFNGKRYYLHPENPNYNDIYLSDFSIQGVAKKVIKDL